MSSLNILFFILMLTVLPHAVSLELQAVDALLTRLDSKRFSASVQESAAKAVLQRLLPTHINSFEFKIVSKVLSFSFNFLFVFSWFVISLFLAYLLLSFNWVSLDFVEYEIRFSVSLL